MKFENRIVRVVMNSKLHDHSKAALGSHRLLNLFAGIERRSLMLLLVWTVGTAISTGIGQNDYIFRENNSAHRASD